MEHGRGAGLRARRIPSIPRAPNISANTEGSGTAVPRIVSVIDSRGVLELVLSLDWRFSWLAAGMLARLRVTVWRIESKEDISDLLSGLIPLCCKQSSCCHEQEPVVFRQE